MLESIGHIVMFGLLGFTVWKDHREHRIPNAIIVAMIVSGFSFQLMSGGLPGLAHALLGLLVGLAVFLIPYCRGGMAAGDVKLLAATGTFLGPGSAFFAGGFALIAGALIAGVTIGYQQLRGVGPTSERILTSRFPFAGAIALGVSIVLLIRVTP